jgi:hypothetical protein
MIRPIHRVAVKVIANIANIDSPRTSIYKDYYIIGELLMNGLNWLTMHVATYLGGLCKLNGKEVWGGVCFSFSIFPINLP